jgi:predicted ATP-grasp superfamily ATP-dependent carboligase
MRAAAFSALRAGLRPWCADLFADADLQARCPAQRLTGPYPHGFLNLIEMAPPIPWTYGGGLENWPRLVAQMARHRPLWGNDQPVLKRARSPQFVRNALKAAGLPAPRIQRRGEKRPPGRWLVKPIRSAGGQSIHFWDGQNPCSSLVRRGDYLQEFIEGESRSAVFRGDGHTARMLGVTRQLVGEDWLRAAPFHYCGSIGPLALSTEETAALTKLGNTLTAACGLRGLFGVDGIERDGTFWPVEINPRYTASVEVLEFATGLQTLAWHRQIFDPTCPPPAPERPASACVGKAILFARADLVFPADGPWTQGLSVPGLIEEMPTFADVPRPGETIRAGRPILTCFARMASSGDCQRELRRTVTDLEAVLFPGLPPTANPI